MDPKGSQGPGGDGEAPAAPAVGRGRAQLLRNLSQRESSVASQALSTTASVGRGILLRGLSTDSTLGDSSITSQGPPPTVAGGRGALLKQLSGGGGPSMTSASSAATSSATARQELMAKIQNRAENAAVVPKPIGRAGLVSILELFSFLKYFWGKLIILNVVEVHSLLFI